MIKINKNIVLYTCLLLGIVTMPLGYGQTLTLEQCKQYALDNNYKIKNSDLEIFAAKEIEKEAFTNYFPKLTAGAIGMQAIDPLLEIKTEGGNLPIYDGNPANLANATQFAYMPGMNMGIFNQVGIGYLNVLQPLYLGGKIKTGNELAKLSTSVKHKEKQLSDKEVLFNTEQQYWQVVVLQEKMKTLEAYELFLDKLHKQVSNAYNNGLVIRNELLKVEIKQNELKVTRLQLQNGKKMAMMLLCHTINIPYDNNLNVADDLAIMVAPESYYVVNEDVIYNRDEYALLENMVTATSLETKMKKSEYIPSIGVGASGYYMDQFENNINGSFNGMVYAKVSIPISDWWGGKHKLNQLKTKEQIAKNTLKENEGLLLLQMEDSWTQLTEAYEKISVLEQTYLQTKENLEVNENSYNFGLIPIADLLEAQALLTETEDKLIEAKSLYKIKTTDYLKVTAR